MWYVCNEIWNKYFLNQYVKQSKDYKVCFLQFDTFAILLIEILKLQSTFL